MQDRNLTKQVPFSICGRYSNNKTSFIQTVFSSSLGFIYIAKSSQFLLADIFP